MNKEVRLFEEYKEMIQDMSKEEMIKGLYDLSARVIKQENIIKKVRESAKGKIKQYESYINDLKKGEFPKETVHRERQELIYRIREQEELLEILDKVGSDKE